MEGRLHSWDLLPWNSENPHGGFYNMILMMRRLGHVSDLKHLSHHGNPTDPLGLPGETGIISKYQNNDMVFTTLPR